jgi:hypothetical protein
MNRFKTLLSYSIERSQLKHDEPLSNCVYKFSLRRYMEGMVQSGVGVIKKRIGKMS